MADPLVELDEAIEKAGLLPHSGSRGALMAGRLKAIGERRSAARANDTFNRIGWLSRRSIRDSERAPRRKKANQYLGDRIKRVRKSSTPLEALDSAIEKARGKGLIPKGGSRKLLQRVADTRANRTPGSWTMRGIRSLRRAEDGLRARVKRSSK